MIICSWYVLVKDTWYDAYPKRVEGNPGCGCSKRGEEDPGQGNHLLAMAALGRGLPAEATIDQAAAKPVAIVTAAAAPRSYWLRCRSSLTESAEAVHARSESSLAVARVS